MSYKLYTDKNETFECNLNVKNATLKGSIARLVVESGDVSLIFNGEIKGDKCVIPVRKLKGLLEENTKGNMHLEVIIEDTYFTPWKSEFVVEEHTSVKVQVQEQKETNISKKPIVEVSITPQKPVVNAAIVKQPPTTNQLSKEIATLCEMFGINSRNIKTTKRTEFKELIKEYFSGNSEYNKFKSKIFSELLTILK